MLVSNVTTPSKFNMLLEAGVVIKTIDLGGRPFLTIYDASFVAIYQGTLTKYIAEVFPFEVSWPLTAQNETDAVIEAKELVNSWLDRMKEHVNAQTT